MARLIGPGARGLTGAGGGGIEEAAGFRGGWCILDGCTLGGTLPVFGSLGARVMRWWRFLLC